MRSMPSVALKVIDQTIKPESLRYIPCCTDVTSRISCGTHFSSIRQFCVSRRWFYRWCVRLAAIRSFFAILRWKYPSTLADPARAGDSQPAAVSSDPADVESSVLPCTAESQFPTRTPSRLAPFTLRMPAAKSGLRRPRSDAS